MIHGIQTTEHINMCVDDMRELHERSRKNVPCLGTTATSELLVAWLPPLSVWLEGSGCESCCDPSGAESGIGSGMG